MAWKFNAHVKSEIPWSLIPIELPVKKAPRSYVSFQNLEITAEIPLEKVGFTFDPRLIPLHSPEILIPPAPEISISRDLFPQDSITRVLPPEISVSTDPLPVLPDFSLIRTPRDPRRRRRLFSPRLFKEIVKPISVEIPANNLPPVSSFNFQQEPLFPLLPNLFSFQEKFEINFPLLPRLLKICTKDGESPSPYSSPSAVNSLEDGEIRESPVAFGEYLENFNGIIDSPACPDQLLETKTVRFRKDLSPPSVNWAVNQAESEVFEIHFKEQGSCVGKSDPPLAVFGRALPRTRPDQFVFTSKKLDQPLSGRKGQSLTESPVDPLTFPERNTRSASPPYKHKYTVQSPECRYIKLTPEIEIPIPKRFKKSKVEIIPSKFFDWNCSCQVQGICQLCYSSSISFNLQILIKCGGGDLTLPVSSPDGGVVPVSSPDGEVSAE